MAGRDELEHGRICSTCGPHPAAQRGEVREAGEQVDLGDPPGRLAHPAGSGEQLAGAARRRCGARSRSDRSCAVRILVSYSFSSGVVNRSALTSVCLRS